ncbi:hypothetical protein IGJ01_000944 [Enterococcus sp. AZ089]|uniref:hypothetical protein n=1 Tax=unclassified Enterococcus TaxID=2608891 RepID=UPI003D2FEC41
MLLEIGMEIIGKDANGVKCRGFVAIFLENSVIIENGTERYLLSKKELSKLGYEFPRNRKLNNRLSLV